jgi:Zn-dependent protease with chaperone function
MTKATSLHDDPVRIARKGSDVTVLIITLVLLCVGGLILATDALELFITAMAFLAFSLLYIRLYQISFLGNAFRVQNGRYAKLKTMVEDVAQDLKMPYVDVFIAQDPYLNAFAIGYTHPFTIVLHSAIVEQLDDKELRAVLCHEMGHIKYKHTMISAYTTPLTQLIPIIGPITGWFFGYWSRRAELTCDRLALAYTRDPHTVITALIKIHVGPKFAEYMQEEGVLYQARVGKGAMRAMAQSLSSHPYLVTRVKEVIKYAEALQLPIAAHTHDMLLGTAVAPTTHQ